MNNIIHFMARLSLLYSLLWSISIIIGKTKSTNFQNEKYKKGMSFKYYINGA